MNKGRRIRTGGEGWSRRDGPVEGEVTGEEEKERKKKGDGIMNCLLVNLQSVNRSVDASVN